MLTSPSSTRVSQALADQSSRPPPAPDTSANPALRLLVTRFSRRHGLSARETIVLELGAMGLHRKEVAYRLACRNATVDTYWRRIFRKTGTGCQSEVLARLLGLALDYSAGHSDAATAGKRL